MPGPIHGQHFSVRVPERQARDFDVLIVHHTEDPDLTGEGVMNEGEFASRLGLIGVPKIAETIMLERDMRLVALTEGRYHAASVTCPESLEVLRRAKDAGLNVTASASINHLALNEIDVGQYRTFFKMSPPLRNEDDRKALVAAVDEGLIDVVMSDHNPQDVEVKRLPFAEAAPGAIGIETMLPAGAVTITAMRGTNHVILTLRSESGVAATLIANRITDSGDRDPNAAIVLGRHGNNLKIERIWLGDHTGFAILPNVD